MALSGGSRGRRESAPLWNEPIFRLAKPVRRGILRLIFSRFLVFILLLVLQVLLIIGFFRWLSGIYPWISSLLRLFTLAMVIYLFNSGMDSGARLTWMLIIAVAPLPGAALLWFTQFDVGHRRIRRRVEELIDATRDVLPRPTGVQEALEADGGGTEDLCVYLNRSGCFPAYDDTEAVYLPSGEAKLAALLPELEKAEAYIYLEYFIIEEGVMWGSVLKLLTEKAAAGVDVRVMYDGMCEMHTLPVNYRKLLRQKGIRAKAFSPIRPVVSSQYNYRDHRKILVIDGKVAFTGGVNLADEYLDCGASRFGRWKDSAVMLRGSAAASFTLMFLQLWNIDEKAPEFPAFPLPQPPEKKPGGWVLPYADCPLDAEKVGETVYMDVLNRAGDYVHIMTPYLILDGKMEAALVYAAQRGVDVKLILPGIPDKKMAWALAKSHYRRLLAAGAEIYEYAPGFVHSKVFVSDGCKAVVGTINLDYRSLYHHFECAAYLYRVPCIREIEADFQDTLSLCRRVTPETVKKEKLFYRLAGSLLKFLAPLM
ncbi:MAG: cardiolipin synthase [Oscillospiraceae bacterium]|nr:cardiolipin synthase [Oscillospiraceae bacterium]